jgi:hypothetical protein
MTDERRAFEVLFCIIALLAVAPLPCSSCGWPTETDRRQLELEHVEIDAPVCVQCTKRRTVVY